MKNAHIQQIQSNRIYTLGLIAAGVIHDLNNPMMGILNFTQYCLSQTSEDDKCYPVLQDIEQVTNRCITIVKNLLSFTGIKGSSDEPFVKCHIESILRIGLQLMSYPMMKHRVSLSNSIQEELPSLSLRKESIQQLILNLLLNALDAVSNSPIREINVQLEKRQGTIHLKISDTGVRVFPKDINKQFVTSFSSKVFGKETALRLAVCKRIVEMHDGTIHAESRSSQDTTFVVSLPIQQGEKDVQKNTCD